MRKNQNSTKIKDKQIYSAVTPNGWSIVIMPDNILIDNYHIGYAHIHPDPNNHSYKLKINKQDCKEVLELVFDYINVVKEFNIEQFVEVLT